MVLSILYHVRHANNSKAGVRGLVVERAGFYTSLYLVDIFETLNASPPSQVQDDDMWRFAMY